MHFPTTFASVKNTVAIATGPVLTIAPTLILATYFWRFPTVDVFAAAIAATTATAVPFVITRTVL